MAGGMAAEGAGAGPTPGGRGAARGGAEGGCAGRAATGTGASCTAGPRDMSQAPNRPKNRIAAAAGQPVRSALSSVRGWSATMSHPSWLLAWPLACSPGHPRPAGGPEQFRAAPQEEHICGTKPPFRPASPVWSGGRAGKVPLERDGPGALLLSWSCRAIATFPPAPPRNSRAATAASASRRWARRRP
ncbi:MAG: hypothetical protein DI601_20625 [Azospirillum brasilense]|nr:MAG: hypothetical protein DI601_20625 [Azospirillum brasilense]